MTQRPVQLYKHSEQCTIALLQVLDKALSPPLPPQFHAHAKCLLEPLTMKSADPVLKQYAPSAPSTEKCPTCNKATTTAASCARRQMAPSTRLGGCRDLTRHSCCCPPASPLLCRSPMLLLLPTCSPPRYPLWVCCVTAAAARQPLPFCAGPHCYYCY